MDKNALGFVRISVVCALTGLVAACGVVPKDPGGVGPDVPDAGLSSDGMPKNALLARVLTVGGPATLSNATVKLGNGPTAITDEAGLAVFTEVPVTDALVVTVVEPGYAEAIQRVSVRDGVFTFIDLTLVKEHARTRFDAAIGGTVDDGAGGRATFPPNALVTQSGTAVTGPVDVSIAPLKLADADQRRGYPGGFQGKRASDHADVILSALAPMARSTAFGSVRVRITTRQVPSCTQFRGDVPPERPRSKKSHPLTGTTLSRPREL